MSDTCFVEDLNTLPEQVQLNKEDIKKLSDSSTTQAEQLQTLSTKVDTNTANIATNTESIDSIKQSYLLKTDASNTYLTKTDASSTYVSKEDYDNRFDTGKIVLTENGFNKIKTMAEEVGTTIELMVTTDFTENVQSNNTNELKLDVFAEFVEPIYRNIHLVPNQTIDDYDDLQGSSESTWYTGNAMLNLPSQDIGYFTISYQKGSILILTLITHF